MMLDDLEMEAEKAVRNAVAEIRNMEQKVIESISND